MNQLLTFLDGVESRSDVYVMAATSRPDLIDPALLRPGRLDKQLFCNFPDERELVDIFTRASRSMDLTEFCSTFLPQLARQYPTFTGADVHATLSSAQIGAINARESQITA